MHTRTLTWFLTIIETFLFLGIGYYVYINPNTKSLGEIFLAISAIMIINRVISNVDDTSLLDELFENIKGSFVSQEQAIEKLESPIKQLARVVDITNSRGFDNFDEILRSYISITNPKLSPIKNSIVQRAQQELLDLNYKQQTPVLDQPDFYRWLYTEFQEAKKGTRIHIVSMGEEVEWTDTHEEREYWRHNCEAAARGVEIVRIFLFDEARLQEAKQNPAIYGHRKGNETGVIGKVVDKKRAQLSYQSTVKDAGQGFVLIDNQMAIIDVFSADGQARGYITYNVADTRKYREVFDKLNLVARDLIFD